MTTFDEIRGGDALSVSATLYRIYRHCPQQALARLEGVYQPASIASLRGLLAHRIFARHLEAGPIARNEFTLACRQEVGLHLGETMASLSMKPSQFDALVEETFDLYTRFTKIPMERFVQAEAPIDVDPVEGITLKGRVDAVFGEEESTTIVDWKTGPDLSGALPQLDFYAMAWSKAYGAAPRSLMAVSVATGEKVVVTPTSDDLDRVESAVADMIVELRSALVERRELPRTGGPECRWCPLLDTCQEGRTAMELLK